MVRRAIVIALAVPGILLGGAVPALAEPPGDPVPVAGPFQPGEGRFAAPSSKVSEPLLMSGAAEPVPYIETARRTRPVAPGTTLTSFDRLDAKGWLRADLLKVDLADDGVRAGYLSPERVAAVEPLSRQAERAGAIAGVNGDFFDINNTGAALGAGVDDGVLVKSAVPGWTGPTAGLDTGGLGQVTRVLLDGRVTLPGGRTQPLDQLNAHFVEKDGLGAFTALWGTASRARVAADGAQRVAEALVVDGEVVSVSDTLGAGDIPADGFVLVGREAGGDLLRTLKPGDAVGLTYRPRAESGRTPAFAVGGNQALIEDGRVLPLTDPAAHPRTAAGFSEDRRTMYLLTVDGRQVDSRGVTMLELAELMREAGAHDALNLDGGGSSTMLAREPGQARGTVENQPSDGAERHTPNGIGLFAARGSGRLKGFWVETAADPAAAPGVGPTRGGRPDRVFTGLTRKLVARGYDETYGPAEGAPRWHSTGPAGTVDEAGVFRGRVAGDVTVKASRGTARGEIKLTVLDRLTRLGATADRVTIASPEATGRFGVVGFDRDGFTAPVEPSDVKLTYDTSAFAIAAGPDGDFVVTPRKSYGSALVTAEVAGVRTAVPVSVGLESRTVAGFEDGARWRFGTARAGGAVEPVAEGHTGPGLRLSYDFTRSTATRTAYAYPPEPITIEGQPQALGAWVYGHGKGEWTAFTVTDAAGQSFSVYGPYITWEGWKRLEVAVPASVAYPIQVTRFYTIETGADRRYTGEVIIDDVTAELPPSVQTPPAPAPEPDPLVVRDGTVDGRKWRFAVVSDAQFVAQDPDSVWVQRARRTLREAVAAKPDFLVVNGDWVDTGYPADLALAKKIFDEEIGDRLPYYYVPGNHEIYGTGSIDGFTRVFGPASRTFDHKGTRFVLLDSSTGSYRTGSFDQIRMLRAALDGAAEDDTINSVTVFAHHPPRDPLPAKNSQLGDRKEAALVEEWLGGFRERSGKGAAYVGSHVGVFDAGRVDGVPYFVNGNAGKAPAAPRGGFNGWTLFGVDPLSRAEIEITRRLPFLRSPGWLYAEVRPHVDELAVEAPGRVAAGETALVRASVTQHGRTLPLAYPMSADWSASPNVRVGDRAGLRAHHVAWFDAETGELHARRAGTVTLAVTVNGVTRRATVELIAEAAAKAS
ncbi:phosphodiester glycosidase family protein [Sphaerisporangium sp. TRM90804]|uniref:phosphodiester glycosidase family protein n=1 Tax=Sphaerisporangium sp. TRM90804 TaxID=3031113 RepID=UPI00244B99E7|nr:phosphodiester glycosidase family protein [Sphaerisporangium sp. TRM90804]MDH2425844.1 phosphodiester glycosidase family protein [Sphaerisporangium sp. TRM90804]